MVKSYPTNQSSIVNPQEFEQLPDSPVNEFPGSDEQADLMNSPEARAERQALRLGVLSVDFAGAPRGRTRPEFEGRDRLPFEFPDTIPEETIVSLAQALAPKQPIFDKFTDHHRAGPDKASIDLYITKANSRRVERITPATPAETRSRIKDKMRRQTQNIADKLQQSQFVDRNIARLRRYSVKTIRYQIGNNLPFDETAITNVADAVEDFGHGLQAESNVDILKTLGDVDLGVKITHIGRAAAEDPEILRNNPALLRLVQIEEKAREDFWEVRLAGTRRSLGDRLTKAHKKDDTDLVAELERLASLRQS